jgi:hypothetical protein
MTTKKRVLLVVGGAQSNELGSGDTARPTISGPYGNPIKDPIAPNGSTAGSMWPTLAGLAGQRGVWLCVHNAAVGSTSIVDSWVGGCRAWASSMIVTRGSYALSGGGMWRCALAAGAVSASTVAPTGTTDTTGADSVPWIYLGTPTAGDVDGAVFASGSARFDPNGYCAAAAAALSRPGFDVKVSYQSIGQGDKTLSTSRGRYSQGLQNYALYMMSQGADLAMIGFTCWGNTAGLTAYYDSTLVPGWRDALAALAGNPKVVAGANLYEELGTLPLVGQNETTPGVFSADNLHMNNQALKLAAARVDLRMQALGL